MAKEGAYQCSQQESSHPAIPMECFESKSQNNDECLQDTVQYTQKSESYMNKFLRNCLRPFRKRIHSQSDHKEEAEVKIKSAIKFHFESHYTKARKELRIPLKAFFHLLLVVLVTIQTVIFAQDNSKITRFVIGNQKAFREYFKQTNKCNQEDIEILYMLQDVYNQITLIVDSYYNISVQAVGSFAHVTEDGILRDIAPNLTMKIHYYDVVCGEDESYLFPYNDSHLTFHTDLFSQNVFNNTDSVNNDDALCCNTTATSSRCSREYCDCSVEEQIKCFINDTVSNLDRIEKIRFDFTLSTFLRESIIQKEAVHVKFGIHITLLNDLYSSMTVNIDVDSDLRRYCGSFKGTTTVDIVIIVLLILSSVTYIVSIINTFTLALDMVEYFKVCHEARLEKSCKFWRCHIKYKSGMGKKQLKIFDLFNKWYILMLFTHVILLVAVILKIIFDYKEDISIPLVECVRILLGIGVFLLWCGLFGLLSRFDSMNELFNTIQIAFPRVWRFAICFIIFFTAFVLCGWLILGPYHPKFRDFSLSVESLYTILNADDLYSTFEDARVNSQSLAVKIFSEIYLALFIFTFIYVVLSLFIGIFTQAYESLPELESESFDCLREWADPDFKPLSCNAVPNPGSSPADETPTLGANNNQQVHNSISNEHYSMQNNEHQVSSFNNTNIEGTQQTDGYVTHQGDD